MKEKYGNAEIFDVEVINRTSVEMEFDATIKQIYLAWTWSVDIPRVIRVTMRCPQQCLQWLSECNGNEKFIEEWFDEIMRGYAAEEIRSWEEEWVSAVPMPLCTINWESAV